MRYELRRIALAEDLKYIASRYEADGEPATLVLLLNNAVVQAKRIQELESREYEEVDT